MPCASNKDAIQSFIKFFKHLAGHPSYYVQGDQKYEVVFAINAMELNVNKYNTYKKPVVFVWPN